MRDAPALPCGHHLTDLEEKTMAETIKLAAEARSEFGKGFARRARMAGRIPAVLYGHGSAPLHITLPAHDTGMALKHANVLFSIDLDGTSELAIAKDIQRDPVRRTIDHIDLLIVKKGEKVTVDVPVHLIGESYPGTIHVLEHSTLSISAEATQLPESIEVSIEDLHAGAKIHARDIVLPAGTELITDADALVVLITTPRGSAADEAADAEVAEAQAAASAAAAGI